MFFFVTIREFLICRFINSNVNLVRRSARHALERKYLALELSSFCRFQPWLTHYLHSSV